MSNLYFFKYRNCKLFSFVDEDKPPLFGKLRVEKNSTLIFPHKFSYFLPWIPNLKYPSKKLWKIWGIEKCACEAQGGPSCNFFDLAVLGLKCYISKQ